LEAASETARSGKAELQRRQAQLRGAEKDTILVFPDEIKPEALDKYFPLADSLGERFSLPSTETPETDPAAAVDLLNTLPFVATSELSPHQVRQHPRVVAANVRLPVERLLGADSIPAWSGRGSEYKNFGTSFERKDGLGSKELGGTYSAAGVEQTSRGAITAYAQRPVDDSGAEVFMVRDTDGEYWGVVSDEGTHRVAAAKLRGENTVTVSHLTINDDRDMRIIPYSVMHQFAGPPPDVQ
jgi:hypothetical protein